MDLQTLSCSGSHKRIVTEAISIFRENGHTVKQIKLPKFEELYLTLIQLYTATGNLKNITEISPGEPLTK